MRQQADRLKNQGNDFIKQEKYKEALEAYNAAIQIDANNSIYYCNRLVRFLLFKSKIERFPSFSKFINYQNQVQMN